MKNLAKELSILIAVGLLFQVLFTQVIYPYYGLPANGPVPLRTIAFVVIISLFFRRSGESWRDFGMRQPFKWWQFTLIIIGLFLSNLLIVQLLKDWLRTTLQLPPNDYAFFAHLHGNEVALVMWLVIAWVAAGFGEEMVFRGYLIGRFKEVFGQDRSALVLAIVGQAIIFGIGHAYAGWGAAVMVFTGALVTGGYLFLTRLSIWPLIIIHGLWDSLAIVLFYLNGRPGT